MTIETMREFYEARPFRPFTLHLADGRNVTVQHPEFMAYHPEGGTLVVFQPGGALKILDVNLITEIETLSQPRG
ncbi:MAG: hypothetical protein HYY24_09585 [Verrucomicrobia bacterium]|nr:hypothetical protein [Verrucomicrobiota bacterium]